MSQLQIALMTLEKITYTGPNVGTNFSFNFDVAGENNQFQLTIMPGATVNLVENLGGIEADPLLGPVNISTKATITAVGPGAPPQGMTNTTYIFQPTPDQQVYVMNVMVGPVIGPWATFTLTYRCYWRDYPVCYDLEWLCRNRYDWTTFGRWLCLGDAQLSDFYVRPEIITLNQTFEDYRPRLQRISDELALGFTPAGPAFLDLQTFSFNVVMGAGLSISTLKWGRIFTIDDFAETVSDKVEAYIIGAHVLLDFQVLELCRRWRELLDCFCRYCRRKATLPAAAVTYYDANIAPHIDALYGQVNTIAVGEGMPAQVAPQNPGVNCDKLGYIVSFWAWWCRRCPLIEPWWSPQLEPFYTTLYDKRQFLNDILEANNYKLCNPPEKNFCDRWKVILDCLKKLCGELDNLPATLKTDIENTFGTFTRNLATFLALPNIAAYLPAGINNTCELLTKLKTYVDKLCPVGTIPGGRIRRTQFDSYLVSFENALTAFKGRNGDLCASSVTMTKCDEWMPPLDCLKDLCNKKHLFTSALRSSILSGFETVINDLFTIAFKTPPTPPPGAAGIDLFCFKLNEVWGFFSARCPSGTIDPIIKLRMEAKLATLTSAYNTLLSNYPDICGSWVETPPTWCDTWETILKCLQRICRRSGSLSYEVLDDVVEDFASIIHILNWIEDEAQPPYDPDSMTLEEICESLDALLEYFNYLCTIGTIDPVLKLFLDEQLADLQSAYNALLTDYPGICYEPDPYCEDWIEMLDCMVRLCDRLKATPTDQVAMGTLDLAVTRFGTSLSSVYEDVFDGPAGSFPSARDQFCAEVHALLDWAVANCACCGATRDDATLALIAERQVVIMSEYRSLVACEAGCGATELSLVTGTAPWVVTRVDDLLLAYPRTPHIVTDTCGIADPVEGSEWISPHEEACDDATGYTIFERCFCVCTPGTIQLDMTFWADDTADIYLDSALVFEVLDSSMSAPATADLTLTVTAGRHCIRAKVHNDPPQNMAFCAIGTITAGTATLLEDECCGDREAPIAPCADVPIPCERIISLPRIFQFLCCPERQAEDKIFTMEAYDELLEALGCFEGEIGVIMLALGELPDAIQLEGSKFCDRMRRIVRVLIRAYMNFRSLPAWLRHRVDCFYDLLRAKVSDMAATELDYPRPCNDECELCTRWLDLLECLCRMCVMRPQIAASHPALAAQIEDLLCFEQYLANNSAPMLYSQLQYIYSSEYSCCEYLIYTFGDVLDKCLCCADAVETLEGYEDSYNWLYERYQTLQAAFTAAGLAPCETLCSKWRTMFECLAKICLRRNELPQSLRDSFDQLFPTRLLLLHDALYGAPPTPTPFANTVFGTTCWGFFRLLRSFTWYCSPLYAFTRDQVRALEEHLADFTSGYNTYMGQLAAAGVTICAQKSDACWQMRRLPEQFRTVCGTTPSGAAAPVVALEALLTQVQSEVPSIQRQLRLPMVAYPITAGFCERLDFMVSLMGAARGRYEELHPSYRALVDLFFSIFSTQVDAYAALIPEQLPRETTPMMEYRNQWVELLDCLCRTCDYIWSLTQAERDGIPTIMAFFTGADARLVDAVDDLYTTVWMLAPTHNAPIINDPCADTLCEKVRILLSFFSIYCLRCNDPAPAVVTALEGALDPLRAATVALRGAMQKAGRVVCPDESFENVIVQSEALYLQAAGSHSTDGSRTGVDGSSVGIHLRWALLGVLGDHIPKGNLAKPGTQYYGTNPFNRKDDFVRVYRAPYGPNQRFAVEIDLTSRAPDSVVGTGQDGVVWTFNNVPYDTTFGDALTTVQISFPGNGGYNWTVPPNGPFDAHAQTVRQNYTGVYRVEAIPKLMFAVEVDVANAGVSPSVRFEAISRNDDPNAYDPNFTSARLEISGAANPHRIESESMEYVLFQCVNCLPTVIRLETFEDFYAGSKRHYLLKRFGEYGLSLDNNEVYTRLEDPAKYPVDGKWPKYITDNVNAPTMRVRVDNYKDRWIPRTAPQPDPANAIYNRPAAQSLREAVVKYLTKSAEWTNVEAWTTEHSIMPGDTTEMKISLLELLQLGAQDYHIARMLGLGTIDWQVTDSTKRYIYVAEYEAPEPLEAQRSQNPLAPTVHRYLSLPTGVLDARLPIVPTLKPLVKGLEPPYTDSQGYTRFGTHRYMRLYRNDLQFDLPVSEQFFNGPVGFSRGLRTRPILFGIRYAKMATQNATEEWMIPDPSNDDSETAGPDYQPYVDKSLQPEVIPIPDLKPREGEPEPPLYTHRMNRADEDSLKSWHRYAIYGINWFSRVSPFVDLKKSESFQNQFPVLNSLQPPLNLKVQYLQREDVPLLNAPSENNASFFEKSRVTFDWNHTHDLAYQFADEVHLYVRSTAPMRIRGKIESSVLYDGNPAYAWVTTADYQDFGNKRTETIKPALKPDEIGRYLGSLLVTPSNKYEIIEAVVDMGRCFTDPDTQEQKCYPRFKVRAIMEAGEDGKMESGQPIVPLVEEIFLVVENITDIDDDDLAAKDWSRLDAHRIKLVKFPVHTETIVTNGRGEDVQIGGLVHASAQVVRQQGEGVTGLYDVTMPGVALGAYNDHVTNPTNLMISFYKGTLRVKDPQDTTKVRALEVLKIVETGPNLKLLVFDPEDRMLSGGGISPMWTNFHPSYRMYVEWQAKEGIDPVDAFEPTAPELSRITYMAAKAADTGRFDSLGRMYRSSATQPAVHLGRLVQDLLPPAAPMGPAYASRPDFYGKASYTFDTPIDSGHVPYGLMFYRADEMAILGALYTMSTIRDLIVPNLPEYRADDEHLEERWSDLINTNLDTNGEFKTYGSESFHFPWPDKALEVEYQGPYKDDFKNLKKPSEIADKIREAVRNAFLPLTESYVVFTQIDESSTLQTSPKKPVLRAPDGALLSPDDDRFDPYPMIRRNASSDPSFRVRFTDYTLDGASRNVYFYFSREVSSGLAAGDASGVKGPVRLVNTMPPVAPNLTSVRVSPENVVMETKAEVIFRFNPPPAGERVREIWIYRALDDADALSIRTMKRLDPIVLTQDLSTTEPFEVRDTFSDIPPTGSIPYGQPIYYRVVVARRITNENAQPELVPSMPSETIMVSVMDTVNPKAPTITVDPDEVMAPPPNETKVLKYTNVVLSWPHTTYNGTYRLYKQSPQGQWTLVKTFAPPHNGSTIVYDWSADHPATQEDPESPNLLKFVDGTVLYHRFKVVVTNSSGLVSLVDNVKTI